MNEIKFKVEKMSEDAHIPTKKYKSDSGYDVYTPISFILKPMEMKLIDFKIKIETLPGYEIQMRNRSGMVTNYHVFMLLGVGTIDEGYRGNIMAPFINFGDKEVMFNKGDRIAQIVIKKTENVELVEENINLETDRGEFGFGSSGK